MNENKPSVVSALNMEQSIDVLRIQRDLAIALSETTDIEEALSLILNSMIKMPEVDSGGIYFVDRNTKSIEMILSVGLSQKFQEKVGYYPGNSPQAEMVNSGKPLFSGPDFPTEQFEPMVVEEGLTAVAALPICRGNIAVACCNVSSHTVNEFSEFTKAALESITELLGTAVTRIASEAALWDVVQRYQRMFMNMHNGVAVFREVDNGRDFVFTDYNGAAERMDGKKKDDILGMRVSKVFPGVFASGIGKLLRQVLETGEPVSYGPLLYCDDQLKAWREGYIYKLASGELVSIFDDVTDQIEAKMELHRINEMLNTVMQSAPLPVFTLDLDGNVTDIWNPAAEDFLGWSKEDVQGKRLPTITDEIREEFQRFLDWMRSGTSMPGVEVKRKKRDGSEVEYSIYGAPLRDSENQISGYVVMLIDLTEKKETEQILHNYREHLEELVDERTSELEQAREKLIESERLALLGNFAGGIAHEIRNPLSVISSAAFFLKRKLDTSDEKVNNNIERISRQVETPRRSSTAYSGLPASTNRSRLRSAFTH